MENKQIYRKYHPDEMPLFLKPMWLDFVCGNSWDVAIVRDENSIKACMPYAYDNFKKPKRIIMPQHTKFLGPFLSIYKNKKESYLSEEIYLLTELEEQLPKYKYYRQSWNVNQMNCLPFLWKKYEAGVKFNYIIKLNRDIENLWDEVNYDTRRLIRNAIKNNISIKDSKDFIPLNTVINNVFDFQKIKNPYSSAFISNINSFIQKNNAGRIVYAVDDNGEYHAGALVLSDDNSEYLFAGGANPAYRSSGANALLIWEQIKVAMQKGKDFNFLGSIIKSKERFIRSFGGELYPYLDIIKDNSQLNQLKKRIKKIL